MLEGYNPYPFLFCLLILKNDVQAWCMLLNDKVPFRMQWPQYTDLAVNGMLIFVGISLLILCIMLSV